MTGTRENAPEKTVRCAIYTRKSTSEGLDMDFNTLDAQREAAEHYIRSQAAQGWSVLPTRYDDGGYTGGNLERPALQKLLEDIDRGEVDMVVVYKVDRLSRSLLDFARVMQVFEKKTVGFVSITQHFDTSSSMGRLVLNVLLSFAQFERELISERTRDKMSAARRRGKWIGGPPVIGYSVDREKRALDIVPEEAEIVRLAFDLYLRTRSILAVAEKLNGLGHTQKRHVTKSGKSIGGRPWDKNAVHRLLHNPIYTGRVRHRGQLYDGEHDAIVSAEVFERVSQIFNTRRPGSAERGAYRSRKSEYLLGGILRCGPCQAAMTSSSGFGHNGVRYRYYRCRRATNERRPCPCGLITADDVEAAVIERVRSLASDGQLQRAILEQVSTQDSVLQAMQNQRDRLAARLNELNAEAKRLLGAFSGVGGGEKLLVGRLSELESEMDNVRGQLTETERQLRGSRDVRDHANQVVEVVNAFDEMWKALVPAEKREFLHLVVREAVVDPKARGIRIVIHDLPAGPTPSAHRGAA